MTNSTQPRTTAAAPARKDPAPTNPASSPHTNRTSVAIPAHTTHSQITTPAEPRA
jgi:hypothetical protein